MLWLGPGLRPCWPVRGVRTSSLMGSTPSWPQGSANWAPYPRLGPAGLRSWTPAGRPVPSSPSPSRGWRCGLQQGHGGGAGLHFAEGGPQPTYVRSGFPGCAGAPKSPRCLAPALAAALPPALPGSPGQVTSQWEQGSPQLTGSHGSCCRGRATPVLTAHRRDVQSRRIQAPLPTASKAGTDTVQLVSGSSGTTRRKGVMAKCGSSHPGGFRTGGLMRSF